MACNRCSGAGPYICQRCAKDLVDRVVDEEKRTNGQLGFKAVEKGGISLIEFLMDRSAAAVDLLHACASEVSDPTRKRECRDAADALFEARKVAKEAIRSTKTDD